MAIINKPDMTNLWASGGAIIAPSGSKVQTGWTAEIPPHQWENWVQNRQDLALGYLFQRGLAEWDENTEYFANQSVVLHEGTIYIANTNSVGEEPSSVSSDWRTLFSDIPVASESQKGVVEIATTAEAIALTDDQRALTPKKLDEALMGGNGRALTPAQFNNSTKIATTEFVKRQGMQSSAFIALNSATTLDATHAGASIFLGGTTSYTITLPLAEMLPPGTRIEFFFSSTSGTQTIQRQGSNIIYLGGGGTTHTSVSGSTGDSITFVTNGANWYGVSGTIQMGHAASFGKFLNSNGYQKLPGGLIIQWFTTTVVSSSSGAVGFTFPIAFPNTAYQLSITPGTTNQPLHANVESFDRFGGSFSVWNPSARVAGQAARIIALGI